MRIFYRVATATAGLPTGGDKVYRYVEVFLWKFVDHFNSCFHLAHGTPVLGRREAFCDTSSINVLVRAAWESYLTFNYNTSKPSRSTSVHFASGRGGWPA